MVVAMTPHLSIWQAVGWSFFVYPMWAIATGAAALFLTDPDRNVHDPFQVGRTMFVTLAALLTFVAVLWSLTLCGIGGTLL